MLDEKQCLYVDIDGTLAVFRKLNTLEPLYEKGYFLNLEPMVNVVAAVKQLVNNPDIEVKILSAVLTDSPYAMDEKNAWLDKYLPEISVANRIFIPCGHNKKDFVNIRSDDYLLDDYTNNLLNWQPPAKGIKLLNGINHTKATWNYDCIRYDKNPSDIATDILKIMQGKEIIRDSNPYIEKLTEQLVKQNEEMMQEPSELGRDDY